LLNFIIANESKKLTIRRSRVVTANAQGRPQWPQAYEPSTQPDTHLLWRHHLHGKW